MSSQRAGALARDLLVARVQHPERYHQALNRASAAIANDRTLAAKLLAAQAALTVVLCELVAALTGQTVAGVVAALADSTRAADAAADAARDGSSL